MGDANSGVNAESMGLRISIGGGGIYLFRHVYVYMGRGEIILLSTLLLTKVPRMWQLA